MKVPTVKSPLTLVSPFTSSLYPESVEVPINKLPALFNNAIVPPDEFWNTIAFVADVVPAPRTVIVPPLKKVLPDETNLYNAPLF